MFSDEEIKELAEKATNERFPLEQKDYLSVNKCDYRAGFVAGMKKARELLVTSFYFVPNGDHEN